MNSLPANFWELPTVAVVCLLIIGALGYYIIRQNNRGGQDRRDHVEFIEGLVNEAKAERIEAKAERATQLAAWNRQSDAWREMCQENTEAVRGVATRSTKAMEEVCQAIKQLDRNEQLRYDAGHAQLSRIEAEIQQRIIDEYEDKE